VRRLSIVAILLCRAALADNGPWVEMEVWDVYRVDGEQNVVLLRTKGPDARVLPIWVGEQEAVAIQLRLSRQLPPRPLTHDLLERLIKTVGAKVVKIQVEGLRERVFLGRIFLKHGKQTYDIDARPSDSIALALGAHAPIFVARAVLDEAGMDATDNGVAHDKDPTDVENLLRRTRQIGKGTSL
jgi:uncharacterized protein